jgi:hypothetical protein
VVNPELDAPSLAIPPTHERTHEAVHGGRVTDPSTEPLRKEIHEAEREIDALECKIQFADLKTTYPHEYAEMRSEQEKHRQHILKCQSVLNEQVAAEQTDGSRGAR